MARNDSSYYGVLTAAINDMMEHGFDGPDRLIYWQKRLADAADRQMGSAHQMEQELREALAAVYRKFVDQGRVLDWHPGVAKFTLEKLRPQIRTELDKRILASADLIRLNREKAKAQTLQRFSGWATSIPAGGSDTTERRTEKVRLRKALAQLPFETRRVLIDQGHKLTASISEVIARDQDAIGVIWRSRWRQSGYDYREDHKERDGQVYMLKGNWALAKGLVKPGAAGWYEDVTAVAQEPFCRCYAQWLYNLRQLPTDMLTAKGAAELQRARDIIAGLKDRT